MTPKPPTPSPADETKGAAHTAGPWQVGVEGDGKPGYVYCDNALGSAVAIVYGEPLWASAFTRTEEEANARLIAAAPDLLEACKAHDAYMLDAGFSGPDSDALHPKATENWRRIRAALARATGAAP